MASTADEAEKSEIGGDGFDNASIDTREQDLTIDNNDNNTVGGEGGGGGKVPGIDAGTAVVEVETPKTNGKVPTASNGFFIPKEADYVAPVDAPVDEPLPPPPPPPPEVAYVNVSATPPDTLPPPPPEIVYANSGSESKTAETSDVIGETEDNPYAVILVEETV